MTEEEKQAFKEHIDETMVPGSRGLFIGRDKNGQLDVFFTDAETDRMISMLERAKQKLMRSLDG